MLLTAIVNKTGTRICLDVYRILTFLCYARYVFGSLHAGSFAKRLTPNALRANILCFFDERLLLLAARTVPNGTRRLKEKQSRTFTCCVVLGHWPYWAQAYAVLPQFFHCVDFE